MFHCWYGCNERRLMKHTKYIRLMTILYQTMNINKFELHRPTALHTSGRNMKSHLSKSFSRAD